MKRPVGMPVAVALACVGFDVYLMGVPTTMWGLALVAFIGLLQLAWNARGEDRSLVAVRARRVAIYGAAVALIILGSFGNVALAASRGARVAAAVKQYRSANGDYPERLEQLVPAYLPELPSCCIRASHSQFDYFRLPGKAHPTLFWVAVMPFGKGSYRFETNELRPNWD